MVWIDVLQRHPAADDPGVGAVSELSRLLVTVSAATPVARSPTPEIRYGRPSCGASIGEDERSAKRKPKRRLWHNSERQRVPGTHPEKRMSWTEAFMASCPGVEVNPETEPLISKTSPRYTQTSIIRG